MDPSPPSDGFQVLSLSGPGGSALEKQVLSLVEAVPDALAPLHHFRHLMVGENMDVMGNCLFVPDAILSSVVDFLHSHAFGFSLLGPASSDQIDAMLERLRSKGEFSEGDTVKVVSGPYKNMTATVESVDGSDVVVSRCVLRRKYQVRVKTGQVRPSIRRQPVDVPRHDYMDTHQDELAIVVDGNNAMDRSMHVYWNASRDRDGMFTGLAQGFYFLLLKLKMLYPEAEVHTVIGSARPAPGRRRESASAFAEALEYNLSWMRRWAAAVGFPLYMEDRRSVDVAFPLVRGLERSREKVYVFSTDRGFFSMVGDRSSLFKPRDLREERRSDALAAEARVYSCDEVCRMFGVSSPERIDWVRAVLGGADGVEGASRWMFKTRSKRVRGLKAIVETSAEGASTADEFKKSLAARHPALKAYVEGPFELGLKRVSADPSGHVEPRRHAEFDEGKASELMYELDMTRELEMFSRVANIYKGMWP